VPGNIGDGEESVSLDGLLQSANHPEELEGEESQATVAAVTQAGLTWLDSPQTPGLRDRKRFQSLWGTEIAIVLAPANFRPRNATRASFANRLGACITTIFLRMDYRRLCLRTENCLSEAVILPS
jgi:hypothetical protein